MHKALATTIKYIDFQLQHQIITFNIKSGKNRYIDDNDITGHWNGFLASPPRHMGMDMQKYNNKEPKKVKNKGKGKYFAKKNQLQIPLSTIDSGQSSQPIQSQSQSQPLLSDQPSSPGRLFKSPKSSEIQQDGSCLLEGVKYTCLCNQQLQQNENLAVNNEQFALCKDCENLLHLAEYARKFVLEHENNEVIDDTWPFMFNSIYDKDKYRERYQQKCEQYGLLSFNPLDIIRPLLNKTDDKNQQSHWKQGRVEKAYLKYKSIAIQNENHDIDHIRHRRKLAAKYLLGRHTVLSNIEYIKKRLTQIFSKITLESIEKDMTSSPHVATSHPHFTHTFMAMGLPKLATIFPTTTQSTAIHELRPSDTSDIAYKLIRKIPKYEKFGNNGSID